MSAEQKHIEIVDAAIDFYAKRLAQIKRIKYLMNNSCHVIKRIYALADTTVDYCADLVLDDDDIVVWQAVGRKIIEIRVDRIKDGLEPVDGAIAVSVICRYIDVA